MFMAITGVGKMRSSKLNVHSSSIHWLSAWMTTWVASGSSESRSSSRLASVGHISARSMLSSSMSFTRGSGSKNASGASMYLGGGATSMSPGFVFDDGFLARNSSSCAPGGATLWNVGFGMYSLILLFSAIFVRPFTSTYLMRPSYSFGRWRVNASVFSYMWLSASNTGKFSLRDTESSSSGSSGGEVEAAPGTGPVEGDELARAREGHEGRAPVIAAEADVGRQRVGGREVLALGPVGGEGGDPRHGTEGGHAHPALAVDRQRVEQRSPTGIAHQL